MPEESSLSTRQLLDKIPNYPCLYRHRNNGTYYGIKKLRGKRKEHSLDTTYRKTAERSLEKWPKRLDQVDAEAAKTTLKDLLDKFVKISLHANLRASMSLICVLISVK